MTDLDHVPWPPEVAARYRTLGYWRGQTFGAWLSELAATHPERTAVVGRTGTVAQRWTFAGLDDRAHRLAAGLHGLGIRPGDNVLLQLPNVPEFLSVVFALFRLGARPVFALPAHRGTELRHVAEWSGATAVITVDAHARFDHGALARATADAVRTVREVVVLDTGSGGTTDGAAGLAELAAADPDHEPADRDPGEVAFLQLSGGSTGLPKLIPRTHDDYLYSVRESARICGLRPDSAYLAVLPVAHNFPLSSPGVFGALHAGAASVLAPAPDAATAFELIEQERVTITGLVPPLAAAWAEAAGRSTRDLSSLEVVLVGGAKCGPELASRIGPALGCRLQQVFGMAEGLVCYTRLDDPDELVLTTQGRPISADDEIRVVNPDDPAAPSDAQVPPGRSGALLTRGPYTIRGYFRAGEHNATAFTADGFYRTGDLVRRGPTGHIEVVGRVKEQINRGGEKVAPAEVEDHLMAHPDVLDAAVVGVPDEYLGERTRAWVVPRPGAAPTGPVLRRFVRERGVAAFKIPDLVEIVPGFPVTGVGKTSRRELREALRDATGPSSPADPIHLEHEERTP
ncbi:MULTISPECIES: (2,3-dihydroxybenzoyl)adenylate synthase [Pseudonocardia]|uniref:2,3-dihydroxybenzoate-AMP ligase n=2 Tax=Pseudonocardia TaxID=1847 RepID=A0A1Y2NAX2_PSEAH|nr:MULTISPECIES: AMP-binding protein [Pseudonocardia]OSY44048.1 2,3-dihydroxybenzoate-AMP ligase [Pseudonocardia autotrophica]TDN74222.1 2,3-dihydroxybenzoate-AMP ligase [Pseudonocardia autotrophica]BBG04982.1 2,3-dihydroxybenzoate-AMP ligase [Pseudonocardia autotrophica]GEC23638.1 2,3-dihydroxybenzoate-AMP ligase [Pseudonocardia saturnea]